MCNSNTEWVIVIQSVCSSGERWLNHIQAYGSLLLEKKDPRGHVSYTKTSIQKCPKEKQPFPQTNTQNPGIEEVHILTAMTQNLSTLRCGLINNTNVKVRGMKGDICLSFGESYGCQLTLWFNNRLKQKQVLIWQEQTSTYIKSGCSGQTTLFVPVHLQNIHGYQNTSNIIIIINV